MKLKVNTESCIGCGACMAIAEDIFEMNEDGLSKVKVDTIPEDKQDVANEAMESCPTGAIVKED